MDVVLGVSMGSTAIGMVLIEGEDADGATVDEDSFHTTAIPGPPGQVLAAILGTREGAAEGGYHLRSTGVAWTDPAEAVALSDALAAHKIENVMLVSAFLAAAALAQAVGQAIGYHHTAMLLVEPDSATLGIVDSDDGSITAVRREPLQSSGHSGHTAAQLAAMVNACDGQQARPEGVFIVGQGVDIRPLKPALEAVAPLRVSAPEEPALALARGAALASANAPLFVSSTAALAYAQDPGTDDVDAYAEVGSRPVADSHAPDPDADADMLRTLVDPSPDETPTRRRPVLLVISAVAVIFIAAVVALEVALAINIRTTVALRPSPQQSLIAPTQQPPPPAPTLQASPPAHQLVPPSVPNAPIAPRVRTPAAPAPAVPVPAAVPAPAPAPAAPVPVPVPVLVPAAPPPVPGIRLPLNLPANPPPVNPPRVSPPTPPVQLPKPMPPVARPTPKPPVQLPTPKPPVQLPLPTAPTAPLLPSPAAPPIPVMPAPVVPPVPVVPPLVPRIPVILPHFGF
ncbi:DUF7159 family protein [Mycobacterium lacus]|uniref:DUF7159 domain-containing protein n=1 Tax=Mycobacterium lacus TaxID=169765 RepID=A0A1X1XIQ4_9MYCO|nr:hypothetical protein [Mycobacterium lacus]MCV7124472.1 hypothetical protein [Mycobacterium lacus]ORV98613.1 hypothetical protein AWC15_11305 [Mycobacterium lacus]BBX97297.1 hypothetical protein MLAC_25910 [Mycobacterium lacus]